MAAYPGDLLLHLESFAVLLVHVRKHRPGAFERAARDLRVDRSVLRRRMQALTDWLATPLLKGRGAELRPTAAGERLNEAAKRLANSVTALRTDVTNAHERIVVACTGTVTSELLPRVLAELEGRTRPVHVTVRRAGGAACEALVRSGDVDIGVVRADEPPRDLASRHLADDRLWLLLPSGHPLATKQKLTLAKLAEVPLVLYGASSRTRSRVMQRLGPLGATIRAEVDGRASAIAYARAGIGAAFVSLLPGHTVNETKVRARDVTTLFGPSRFYVIARRERWAEAVVVDVTNRIVAAATMK